MMKKIKNSIEEHHMLEYGERVLVCVSGGADSMCLLNVLMLIQDVYNIELMVIHVNHNLRGDDAKEDERYVKEFCNKAGIECIIKQADVLKTAKKKGWSIEEAGRNIRYQLFEETADNYKCSKIAVAHHMEDMAETVLFYMFRGTGLKGMCGIPPKRGRIIRPLILISKEEIENFLTDNNIKWRLDKSNLSDAYTRNKIRNKILAYAKKEINPHASSHIAELSFQMRELYEYIFDETEKAYNIVVKQKDNKLIVCVPRFLEYPLALRKEILIMVMEKCSNGKKDLSVRHIEDIHSLFYGYSGRQINLPKGIIARKEYDNIIFIKENSMLNMEEYDYIDDLVIPGKYELPWLNKHLKLDIKVYNYSDIIPKNNYTKWFDYDKIDNAVNLRSRNESDFLQIHKDGGRKSLKSLFIDLKIPKAERDRILILADGSHVLWIPGIRASEGYHVDECTKHVLTAEII